MTRSKKGNRNAMANVVVLGAQWGDEGKAKIIDMLAEDADMVVRCQGGCNAGHTVSHKGEVFKFHLVPSGMLYGNKQCLIGNGTVIHPDVLMGEIRELESKGFDVSGLKVSNRAHITLPFHIELDKASETALEGKKIGTTGRGIGPTYMDKVGRWGLRIGDLFEPEDILRARLQQIVSRQNTLTERCYPDFKPECVNELYALCRQYADQLAPFVADTIDLLHEAIGRGEKVLFEGAQGTLLDVDYGTYPYVTSSNATAGGICTGSGIGPTRLDFVLGVMKAYTTRVGEGPFPTETQDDAGRHLQEVGREFGTTTGRARRCGWFDAVVARYGVRVNGLDGLAITKLDVLDGMPELKICTGYRSINTGDVSLQFPAATSGLSQVEPVYEILPGWSESTADVRSYDDLPQAAKTYLERISELSGCPITIVSVGPDRDQTIVLNNPLTNARPAQRAIAR